MGVEAVVVRRKKKDKGASQWSPRLAGVLLGAFFILGVMTGFSEPGRRLVLRASRLIRSWTDRASTEFAPLKGAADQSIASIELSFGLRRVIETPAIVATSVTRGASTAIAIVERPDGFY